MTRNPEAAKAIGHMIARMTTDLVQQQPVVTFCPICRRANPCPLHLFAEQVANRAGETNMLKWGK
jgi:hypothetical protein